MALVIETGSGDNPLANSYAGVEEARAYADIRGIELPDEDEAVEAMLVKAMDYLEAQRARYQGAKAHPGTQPLQWPRVGVVLDCSYALPSDVIPVELKNAQMQLVLELHAGMDLMPSSDGRVVKKEKVDVIETEYMTGQDMGTSGLPRPSLPAVDALLEPLFAACGGGFFLKTVRV